MTSQSTADRIVESARVLIQENGYGALRYEDVSAAVGVRRPSIHHHFPRKQDLGMEVIGDYTEKMVAKLEMVDETVSGPVEKLDGYFDLYRGVLAEDKARMCPGGMLAAETQALPVALRQAVSTYFDVNERWLDQVLAEGARAGVWGSGVTASSVIALLQGGLLLARLREDPAVLDTAIDQLREWLQPDQ